MIKNFNKSLFMNENIFTFFNKYFYLLYLTNTNTNI